MTGVGTYRKKPVEVEAVQLTPYPGDNLDEVVNWVRAGGANARVTWGGDTAGQPMLVIGTLEGNMTGQVGDWIIKGTKGEFYPCKPDIFEDIYEEVDEDENADHPQLIHRDAGTGLFVTDAYAEEHPDTTVKETNA